MSISDSYNINILRQHAEAIFTAGLHQVKADQCIYNHCSVDASELVVSDRRFDLNGFERILVIGAGKATAYMARAMEQLLGNRLTHGRIVVKYGHIAPLEKIETIEAGHPVPDQNGIDGARAILSLAESARGSDLVICLLSGGGSALLALPAPGLTLEDKQQTIGVLMKCGAGINEINTIRKHISAIKGGQLAKAAHPATIISLILSDVVGDKLDIIASGPTVADSSSYCDCLDIVERFNISSQLPPAVIEHLKKGAAGQLPETPKSSDPAFKNITNRIVGSNTTALHAAKIHAESLGYSTMILSSMIEGDTRAAARLHSAVAKEIRKNGHPVPPPACILSGGETTVEVTGSGKGGRNQEFALACAFDIANIEKTVLLSAGTDGTDGPTDAAGAIVDPGSIEKADRMSMNAEVYLNNNDAYTFFSKTGDLLITGPTGTNVMDMRVLLVG